MRPRNVKFQNHNENADRHLFACALRWRPFYAPKDFTVTTDLVITVYTPIPIIHTALPDRHQCGGQFSVLGGSDSTSEYFIFCIIKIQQIIGMGISGKGTDSVKNICIHKACPAIFYYITEWRPALVLLVIGRLCRRKGNRGVVAKSDAGKGQEAIITTACQIDLYRINSRFYSDRQCFARKILGPIPDQRICNHDLPRVQFQQANIFSCDTICPVRICQQSAVHFVNCNQIVDFFLAQVGLLSLHWQSETI